MTPLHALAICVLLCATSAASPKTLLIDRTRVENVRMPARGLTDVAVESSFGAPAAKLEPRGGQRSQWPRISRWVYPGFTVYFENGRVIDAVAKRSSPDEIGPKLPIR